MSAAAVMGIASCSGSSEVRTEEYGYTGREAAGYADEMVMVYNPDEVASVFNKRVPPLNSLIVCRDKQCAPVELSKSREYIFNALTQLVDNNLDSTALLCEANPQAHVCVNPYVTVPAKIGVTPAYVYFDGVKIIDASIKDGQTGLDLVLGYNLSYNGQTPTVCKPDKAILYVKNNNKVVLNGNGFKCDMTSVGTTTIRVLFNVDYIDLDYGYIGVAPDDRSYNLYYLFLLHLPTHNLIPNSIRLELRQYKDPEHLLDMCPGEVLLDPPVVLCPIF